MPITLKANPATAPMIANPLDPTTILNGSI